LEELLLYSIELVPNSEIESKQEDWKLVLAAWTGEPGPFSDQAELELSSLEVVAFGRMLVIVLQVVRGY
jgi:hypothetical protein